MKNAGEIVDLSHTIEPEMPLFSPQVPKPKLTAWMSHAKARISGRYRDCSCEISQVEFVTSLGTYLDSPYHFHPDAGAIESLPLESLILPGLVVECGPINECAEVGPELLAGLDFEGRAVLFRTGWSQYWGRDRYHRFPYLTKQTALALLSGRAGLVGIDTLMIDNPGDPARPVHVNLLGAGIPIVENLTALNKLPSQGFTFHAAPVKFKGAAAFPVRAYATL